MLFTIITVGVITLITSWIVDKITLTSQGRYVLITGCDTGFGNLLAKSLDKKGCHVFATCLTTEGAESLKKVSSDRLHTILMDVTDSESIKVAFEAVSDILAKDSATLWGVVNNAGIPGYPGTYYDWWTRDEYRRILDVNLLGAVEVTNVFLPLLRKVGQGRVVNISSGIGLVPFSVSGYEMAKCGMEGFSDGLRQQMYNTSVSVHVINPGYFTTNMVVDSSRKSEDIFDKVWNRMPESQQNYYGRKCVDEARDNVKKLAEKADQRLYRVTDAIEHALFAWYPWKRYLVSRNAIAWPLKLSPAFISDYIITKVLLPLPKPQGVNH